MSLQKDHNSILRSWQKCQDPPENEFFHAFVCHVEKTYYYTIHWLSEATDQYDFHELMQYMRLALPTAVPLSWRNITVNQLAIVIVNNSPHRVKVLQLDRPECSVFVLLIDYGETLLVNISSLFEADEYLQTFPPFAFSAVIMNATQELEKNVCVSVCWQAQQFTPEGYYLLTMQDIGTDVAEISKKVQVVKEINLRTQLLFVEHPSLTSHFELFLASMQKEEMRQDDGMLAAGQIVAAWHQSSWKRAYLLCHIQLSQRIYLVYLIDEGLTILCSTLCYLPAHFMQEKARLYVLECMDTVAMFAPNCCGALNISENEEPSILILNKSYRVRVLDPQQLFSNCNYGFWLEELKHGDKVHIASVQAINELWVVGDLSLLREALAQLALTCTPSIACVDNDELVVAHAITTDGTYYFLRGHITYLYEDGLADMFDVDTGTTVYVDGNDVRLASDFVRALPAHVGFYLFYKRNVNVSELRMRMALDTLERMKRNGTELNLVSMDDRKVEVDMLYYDEYNTCYLLSELIFGEVRTPQRRHEQEYCTYQQLTKLALPEGPYKSLYVMDFSKLSKGLLSVIYFTRSLVTTMKLKDIAIREHCEHARQACSEYKPRYCYQLLR